MAAYRLMQQIIAQVIAPRLSDPAQFVPAVALRR